DKKKKSTKHFVFRGVDGRAQGRQGNIRFTRLSCCINPLRRGVHLGRFWMVELAVLIFVGFYIHEKVRIFVCHSNNGNKAAVTRQAK
ncbi:hypothetical protein, partial [Enterobacter hormaechei]|uniref:hypothetical protein n=1 Tax=Enterobacter hormaechei TaxID=158836 RepID=UPI002875D458